MRKTLEDIIISDLHTTNDDHIMYGLWDIECDRQNFLSFWTVFCPFTPTNNLENENFEKMNKKARRYYHFTHMYHKLKSYDVSFLMYPFAHFLPKKCEFYKNEKNTWRYHHFTYVYQKIIIRWCMDSEIWCATDGRMDRRTDRKGDI